MLKHRSDQALPALLAALDLALTAGCWVAAYGLRVHTPLFPEAVDPPPFSWCLRTLPALLLLAAFSYRATGLYQLGRRRACVQELSRTARAAAGVLLLWLAMSFFIKEPYESRLIALTFVGLTTLCLLGVRRVVDGHLRRRRGAGGPRALVVGTGRLARGVTRGLHKNHWLGVTPVGYVDDVPADRPPRTGPVLGGLADLPRLVEEHGVDYVFVALPPERHRCTHQVFESLADTLAEVRLVPAVPRHASRHVQWHSLDGVPVLSYAVAPHDLVSSTLKRFMDLTLSAIALVVLSPLLAVLAVLVKRSSPGPVFYVQERMGLNGRRFDMLKFRTMRQDAEVATGPVWAKAEDDRRTELGTFLRRTSLDELPQLWNVLVGDMSLVGPRPERPHFVDQFRQKVPSYMLRHAVKAGITGWAQVHGWRGNTSLRKRIQYDLYYITNWSIWLDIRILWLTVTRVLFDKNAY